MNILNIIKDEHRKLLNENYVMEHDNFKFQQKIKNPTFTNYASFSNDYDIEISKSDILINWRIGFELNDMGVENFIVQGDSAEGNYHIEYRDKQSDEIVQEVDKQISEHQWSFIIDDAQLKLSETLYINDAQFDFKSMKCTLIFQDPYIEY